MAKAIGILVLWLVILLPVCAVAGYLIGYVIAPIAFSDQLNPDFYEHDRELIAGIYGIMFIGGFLYLVSSVAVILTWLKRQRAS
ncbi:MAG: hypothetical protein ACRECY_18120 [Phyllobacterium sp.]